MSNDTALNQRVLSVLRAPRRFTDRRGVTLRMVSLRASPARA